MDTMVCEISSAGMNPVGSVLASTKEPMKNSKTARLVYSRCERHQAAQRVYRVSQRGSLWLVTIGLSRYAAIIGVSIRATTREKKTAMEAVQPNWTKNLPTTPLMKAVGKKTATREKVVAMTARPISSAASMAA